MASVLSDQMSGLKLQTKTVGEDRIRKAKERNEDIAVLSMERPGQENPFKCSAGEDCLMGDPTILPLGSVYNFLLVLKHAYGYI
ncbi:hypothetical protein QE152_g10279 [Popillia japonica]|uniref:Uncharacterized protein n=1 Tax=Popillia japonica TaxID=7064 RepID=A0AAW1LVM1_POPJA